MAVNIALAGNGGVGLNPTSLESLKILSKSVTVSIKSSFASWSILKDKVSAINAHISINIIAIEDSEKSLNWSPKFFLIISSILDLNEK